MKYFYYGLNVFLIVAVPLMIFVNKDFNTASVDYGAKVLNSNEFISSVQAREVTQPEVFQIIVMVILVKMLVLKVVFHYWKSQYLLMLQVQV